MCRGRAPIAARALVLSCALAAAIPVHAQAPAITVRHGGAGAQRVEPGRVATVAFRVANHTRVPLPVRTHAELPAGWRLVLPESPLRLAPGQAETRLVVVAVPAGARAGSYHVGYEASAERGARVRARDSIAIIVAEHHRLQLSATEIPRSVTAGERYVATFTLTNRGNARARGRLLLASSHALPAEGDSLRFDLSPGREQVVRVAVHTTRAATHAFPHRLDLRAVAVGDSATAAAHAVVEVFPGDGAGVSRFHDLPVQLAVRGTRLPTGAWAQSGELRAAGVLREGGDTYLDLLVRGPRPTWSPFGERDQYRLRVRSNRFDLRLGDHYYALSPLTATGRAGFGGAGSLTVGRVTAGGFAQRDRFGWPGAPAAQRGGFLELQLPARSRLGVNYLTMTGPDSGTMASVRTVVGWLPRTRVDAEFGVGLGRAEPAAAHSVELTSALPRVNVRLAHRRLADDYPGLDRSAAYDQAYVSVNPWRRLTLSGELIDRASRPGPRSAVLLAGEGERYRSYRAAIAYGAHAVADVRSVEREGLAFGGPFDVRQDAVGLGLGARLGVIHLRPRAEVGTITDHRTGERSPFHRLRLESGLRIGGGQPLTAIVERFQGRTLYSSLEQRSIMAGVRLDAGLGGGTRFRFSGNVVKPELPSTRLFGVLDVALEQRMPFGHRITMRARALSLSAGALREHTAGQVEYAIPLGIPVGHSRRSARVVVRVRDAETGAPLANAVVRLGDRRVVSDRQGRAVFSGLLPREYPLRVEIEHMAAGMVSTRDEARPVLAERGRTTTVDVGITRGARLSGAVRRFEPARGARALGDSSAVVAAAAVGGALVSAWQGGDTIRGVTNGDGRFNFAGLRPGRWTLKVSAAELPAHHYLEHDTLSIQLAAGERSDLLLRVLPRRRAVRMLTQGEVVLRPGAGAVEPRPAPAPTGRPRLTPENEEPIARREAHRPAARRRTYTVSRWDTDLPFIARVVYGDASLWPKLWLANERQLPTPLALRPGQRLLVPDKAPLTPEEIEARYQFLVRTPNARAFNMPVVVHRYTVTRWDIGLMDIARKVYDDASLWPKIWLANQDRVANPNVLRVGVLLLIPDKAPLTPDEIAARDAHLGGRTK
jgi:hypothetical protein